MPATVVHALAVRPDDAGGAKVRATIREGALAPGDELWFGPAGASRRTVTVRSLTPGRRHLLLELDGAGLGELQAGDYLYRD